MCILDRGFLGWHLFERDNLLEIVGDDKEGDEEGDGKGEEKRPRGKFQPALKYRSMMWKEMTTAPGKTARS